MRRSLLITLGALSLGAGIVALAARADDGNADAERLRIGTYDNRAIAIAFAASEHNPVRLKLAEHEKAKAAGDDATVEALERWGETFQKQLHFQGFGRYPVSDLLAPVRDKLPDVAAAKGLDAIVWTCDFTGEGVEVVDVTWDLVKLYDPSPKTARTVAELRTKLPATFAELIEMDAGR